MEIIKTIDDMISLNRQQGKFYDEVLSAEVDRDHLKPADAPANILTKLWWRLRYRQEAALKEAGIEDKLNEAHARWASLKAGGDFLEVGCFSGSKFTFKLAELAGSYSGVELSTKAVSALNLKFATRQLGHKAKAEAVDFLQLDSKRKFDLIYANGVLHHFENPAVMFDKLAALGKPNAILVFCEPSAVNQLYSFLRSAYRPFQADAAWEWPFTLQTVAALEKHFQLIEGFGWGMRSLPLSVLTGLPLIGGVIRPWYLRMAKAEAAKGWHDSVWRNSYVTAMYQLRDDIHSEQHKAVKIV